MDKITEAYKEMIAKKPVLKEAIGPKKPMEPYKFNPDDINYDIKITARQLKEWGNKLDEHCVDVPEDIVDWEDFIINTVTAEVERA